jgi:hypothetical protein
MARGAGQLVGAGSRQVSKRGPSGRVLLAECKGFPCIRWVSHAPSLEAESFL